MQGLKNILQTILTLAIILGITTTLYLYTSGYRLKKDDLNNLDLSQTGMVSTKSLPESASVYLDGKLMTATNDTIAAIEPGPHLLKIVKKGFVEWQKEIEVMPELVTDITAVLVSQSPRLDPLTNTGARGPRISPSLSKLAYFSTDKTDPGIWVIPLRGTLSLFKAVPTVAIEDTRFTKYSEALNVEWSPDENKLLVEGNNEIYYLVDLNKNTAETTASPELVKQDWAEQLLEKRTEFVDKLELPDPIKKIALSEQAIWSPDDRKFLFTSQNGVNTDYKVYNMEDPLPVGEKVETLVFTTNTKDPQPSITWYSDSFHLILTEGDVTGAKRGNISLIRIDGTNKTEIYSNTLMDNEVFSSPDGEKVIILTSFKSGEQTDLYTVSIR
jgi:hypothetical protein